MDGGMDCFLKPEKDPKGNSNLKTMRNYFSIFLGVAIMDRWMDILRHWLVRGKSYNAVMWNCKHWAETVHVFCAKRSLTKVKCSDMFFMSSKFKWLTSERTWHLVLCVSSLPWAQQAIVCRNWHSKEKGGLQFFPESNGTRDPKSFLTPSIDTGVQRVPWVSIRKVWWRFPFDGQVTYLEKPNT